MKLANVGDGEPALGRALSTGAAPATTSGTPQPSFSLYRPIQDLVPVSEALMWELTRACGSTPLSISESLSPEHARASPSAFPLPKHGDPP